MDNDYNHYFRDVRHLEYIDVYRVLSLFGVTDPCIQHSVKKLLVAGGRGAKDTQKDIAEAIVSLQRWQQMQSEEIGPREPGPIKPRAKSPVPPVPPAPLGFPKAPI